jgi:hypothetical protein
MARRAASWLLETRPLRRTVTIKVRYNDFTTITRSHTEPPCRDEERIVSRALTSSSHTMPTRPIRCWGERAQPLRLTAVLPEGPLSFPSTTSPSTRPERIEASLRTRLGHGGHDPTRKIESNRDRRLGRCSIASPPNARNARGASGSSANVYCTS